VFYVESRLSLLFSTRRAKLGVIERGDQYGPQSALESPSWAKTMILYEIFPRSFSTEGTFARVTEKLPEIKALGVNTIWLMPIHPIGVVGRKGKLGSPYAIQDYLAVNPEYGTKEDFRKLVREAHRLDLRVLMDMVANHTANDHVEMKAHPEWFMRDQEGNFIREVADWSDVTDLNYNHPDLRRYMMDVLTYWVAEFDIDGYRCDVAGMVPEDFWVEARAALKKIKPDIFLLAEWEDPRMHLATFDATYDWTLYYTLLDIRKGRLNAEAAVDTVLVREAQYPRGSLRLRFLENHDQQRAAKVFGYPELKPFAVFIFTIGGIPLLYAGQETADTLRINLFDKIEARWDKGYPDARAFYQSLTTLRRENPVFVDGQMIKIPTTASKKVAAFARLTHDAVAVIATNLSPDPVQATLVFPDRLRKGNENLVFRDLKGYPAAVLSSARKAIRLAPFDYLILMSPKQ